jgi:Zn-dependent M28 family amino/carboxypeptidase
MRRAAIALAIALFAAGCGGNDEDSTAAAPESPTGSFDAQRAWEDLQAQVEIGPRPSGSPAARETARLIARRLDEAGVGDIAIQEPYENVVGTLAGRGDGVVIVGAHYDTKDAIQGFVGANDGASGVAVMLEVARALPRPLDGPSVQFVAFDAEEPRGQRDFLDDGARGSRQFVEFATAGGQQGAPPLDDIVAMVLFDMVGDCDLEVPRETSSDAELYGAFADAATELTGGPGPFEGTFGGVVDDHTEFIAAGVPAVDLIDFDYGPGGPPGDWWHTPEDSLDKVCPESLNAVGEPALRAIPRIR